MGSAEALGSNKLGAGNTKRRKNSWGVIVTHRFNGKDLEEVVNLFLGQLDKESLHVLLQVLDPLSTRDGEDILTLQHNA